MLATNTLTIGTTHNSTTRLLRLPAEIRTKVFALVLGNMII
jgi:hypothetical protein